MADKLSYEARQRYTAYYSNLLKKRLSWALEYVRNTPQPLAIQEHMATWLQILQECHRPELYVDGATLISLLHPWPLHWGYWSDWERELSFALNDSNVLQSPKNRAEFLNHLANLMFLTGRRDEALRLGSEAVSIGLTSHALIPLSKSGVLVASILLERQREQDAKEISDRVEQEIEGQSIRGKQDVEFATARAYFSSHKARRLFRSGSEDAALGLMDSVIEHLEQISEIDPNVLADSYGMRSGFNWAQDKYLVAIEDVQRAIELVSSAGYEFAASAFRGNLGVCYWTTGEFKLAEETLRQCIHLAEQSHIYFRLAYDMGNLALVFLSQGRIQDAVTMSERHMAVAKDRSSPAENMRALDNYGIIKFHAGDYQAAENALKVNVAAYEIKSLKIDIVIQLSNLARCYAAVGEISKAIDAAEKALNYAQGQNYSSPKILALRCMAEFKSSHESQSLLEQALALAQQCNRPFDQAGCLLSLAHIEKNRNKRKELWQDGCQLLYKMEASAWLDGHSINHPPQLPLIC